MQGALDISKNVLEEKKIFFSRGVKELTDIVDSVNDIGTRNSQIP